MGVFWCPRYFLLPIDLCHLVNRTKARLGRLCLHLGHTHRSVFFHELIFVVKIDVIFRQLIELLLVHHVLWIIVFKAFKRLRLDLVVRGYLLVRLVIAHLDLDVIPLGCHSCHHLSSSILQ